MGREGAYQQLIYLVSMLQTIGAASPALAHSYFYDHLNRQLYFIQANQLHTRHLTTQQEATIPIRHHAAVAGASAQPQLVVVSGEAVANVARSIVSSGSEECVVRGTNEVVEGSAWEWFAPISLQKIKLGICKIEDNQEIAYELFEFNSSTPRTVTFRVEGDQLKVLVNGHPPAKNPSKKICFQFGKAKWFPCAKIEEKGNSLVFAPFCFESGLSLQAQHNLVLGAGKDEVPNFISTAPVEFKEAKLKKLVQLSKDSFLLIWNNEAARLVQRNPKTGNFDLLALAVQQDNVFDLFSEQEYAQLSGWRGQSPLLPYSQVVTLDHAYNWLKYLLKETAFVKGQYSSDIYFLLLSKLAIIRPHLLNLKLQVPDLTPLLARFAEEKERLPAVVRSNTQWKIEGSVLDVSQHYLVSKIQNTIILYNLQQGITEIFREVVDQKLLFSKRTATENYDEEDIRSLKNQGSFLYKILSGCLQKGKRTEELHAVNDNDVRELVKDYGIDQRAAREALEYTGHVQQALVWIFTDKKSAKGKKGQPSKEVEVERVECVHILQLDNMFARVLLQVGSRIFVLGMLPNQLKNWCYKGQKDYVDLLSLKHEEDIADLDWRAWYSGSRHPRLQILDEIEVPQVPDLLFRQGTNLYYLVQEEGVYHKKRIEFNADLLYEAQESLTIAESAPLQYFVAKDALAKTLSGQLILEENIKSAEFSADTVWISGGQLYSNITYDLVKITEVSFDAPYTLLPSFAGQEKALPFIVQSGPPGCSSNYSITSMLKPKSSFLANYPAKVTFRHLHGKLIRLTAFTLHRSSHRKNVNYIQEGEIYLVDELGNQSNRVTFAFDAGQNQKEIKVEESGYWRFVVLAPRFTNIKKLPYEYGFVSIKGCDVSAELYESNYHRQIQSLLTQQIGQPVTVVGVERQPLEPLKVQIAVQGELNASLKHKPSVTSAQKVTKKKDINYLSPAQILKLLYPTSNSLQNTLRSISQSSSFTLARFSKAEVFKFIDLVIYSTGSLLPFQEYFQNMFAKIWQNQFGQEYLLQLAASLEQAPTIPYPYLQLLIAKLDSQRHKSTIKAILALLPKVRSPRYQTLDRKYSQLLFETQFYSSHYLNLIDGAAASNQQVFREPVIQAEIVAIKGEYSRRIVVKLPSLHYISDFSLRVERCEQASRAKYKVFALEKTGKRKIGSGEIHEHQWSQIARQIYKQAQDDADSLKWLNIYGLNVPPTTAQYLQIELLFTESGILSHESQASKIPQIDILPELYGYPVGTDARLQSVDNLFAFNPEEMFFLSVNSMGLRALQKFSASRGKQTEYLYFKQQSEDQAVFKAKIHEKTEKGDFDALVNIQRKLISTTRQFSSKICLDYLYTVLILCLNQLESAEVKLQDEICRDLFEQIVRASQGPVKISAFKALSKNIPLLVKSLQFVEEELPTLGHLTFSYEELLDVIDLGNAELCQSLTRLVLRVVSYESRWVELLIKMSPKTQAHEEIAKYFLVSDEWLANNAILDYVANLPDQFFHSTFLNLVSYSQLCKLVTKKSAKPRLQLLLQVIVQKASEVNQVDLDVVGLIFQQQEVRWDQLQKVVACCSQAVDTVIHQFLQSQTPEVLALQYSSLLVTAARAKYSQEFATFLNLIYSRDRSAFKEVLLSISGKLTSLHYDCLDTVGNFIFSSCNFGGVEGVRLLGESDLASLHVAVEALQIIEKVPEAAEMPSQEGFIEWYLSNNDYEEANRNPANKSPGYHLIRQLIELVCTLLKNTSSSRILAKYAALVRKLRTSRRINLFQKHLTFNQLHHGATQLLTHTLTPGSLADVLIGSQNPALATVINELKSSLMKEGGKARWGNTKEIDVTEKFELVPEAKQLQAGKNGSKAPAIKVPLSQKTIRLESAAPEWPSKLIVGFCLNDNSENKNAILPAKVQLYGGNGASLFKLGELKVIEDQYYLSFGVKLYSLDFSSTASLGSSGMRALELRLAEPLLSSASQILQNGQKSKKGATYNISFINISGYDSLPTEEPDYSQLYVTLLGFLGQPKYHADLKKVVASELFDQKLQLIIQVLNDLLPNELIQNLLITLNKEGENILEHILRSKGANSRLISRLILGKLTKDNIGKLLAYTLSNLTPEYVAIVTMSIRLASYSSSDREPTKLLSDFANIQKLVEKYQTAEGVSKGLYYQILVSLLTVPNLYHYQISKLIKLVWNSARKTDLYTLLAAVLPYYHQEIEVFSNNGYTITVLEELLSVLKENKAAGQILKNPHSHIMLLNSLIASNSSREALLQKKAPISIVELLKSEKTLLQKYSPEVMKLFITFFQGTCISTPCQDQFSEILIDLMTSLNNFDSIYHQFFIQNFFFPLINAFQGVPLFFVWKEKEHYIWQPTESLKRNPIRSSANVVNFKGKFYAPNQHITQSSLKSNLAVVLKENNQIRFAIADNEAIDVQTNKKVPFTFNDGKITLNISAEESIVIPNDKYAISEESEWENQLLTNTTLINLQNPWILQEKYRSVLPIKESTTERCYFLPLEITLEEVIKTINISGFRVHSSDLTNIKVRNYLTNTEVAQSLTLREILQTQKLSYLKLELEASLLFQSTTIESLIEETTRPAAFVPQETIFKAFEEKKGLEKLIGVLTGCVKNWANSEQSKIWQQYLKELESYSCFPVFSSLYMTRQSNVNLLFDLLFGLPDKQDSKKWLQKEKESVKELYAIIKDVFAVEGQQALTVRNYALKSGFYSTMLNRLHLITKEPKREKVEEIKEDEEVLPSLEKKESEEEFKNKLQKRKGVGYGTDSSSNQKWDVTGQQQARKEQSEQILGLLKILEKFLDSKDFDYPEEILQQTFESSLLPIIENSLRGGSLLEISKYAELIQGELSFIQVIAKSKKLIPTLMPLPKNYEPRQPESLHSLLKTLSNTSKIFLSCLTGSASEKVSQEIAKKIAATFDLVDEAVSEYETAHNDEEQDRKILELPLSKKYPILLKDLRFDYIDMKDTNGKITKHHYASYYQAGHKSPVEKTVRLAQELADVSHALPIDHTNAIFVRCDKERVDYMQALIMGSNGTPYGHGAYLFDIYFEDNYPNGPPKVNLTTTGNGQIRFNPNLYSCGKVCLSLLGTWRGSAMENWDAKVSTLLQVLVSIQSIIMSEDIYFNEPGFEHEQGTLQGEKKNEAYANIVRYGNVKFAMIENIKNPPKGFETIIRRHFFLKKAEILEECQRWLKLAQKREASYNGLVSDHNYNWCNTFKKSKTEYKTMLEKAVKELQTELNKLPVPTSEDLKKEQSPLKKKKKEHLNISPTKLDAVMEEIDVSYGEARENVELDINDQKVKDRWSRYIGAMGVQAVSKQSKASILLLGLGPLGIEIAKNIVLSGCKELAVWDNKQVQWSDLSGQFFLEERDIGKPRLESSIYKLQELNHYVRVSKFDYDAANLDNLAKFQVVVATERPHEEQQAIDHFCRSNKIHFVSADCYGPFGQLFNDFGEEFEILDKNGEEPVEVILQEITNAEKGLVRVSKGLRHPFEDGESIRLLGVKGMKSTTNDAQSINGTIHQVKVIDQFSFYIGDTTGYTAYEGDGTAKNIKTPSKLKFKSLKEASDEQIIDSNLEYYDFTKGPFLRLLHHAFRALGQFQTKHSRLPSHNSKEDALELIEQVKKTKPELSDGDIKYLKLFSITCSGHFGPICALYGGVASQEVFKSITGKYTPINQYFLSDFSEVIENLSEDEEGWQAFIEDRKPSEDRREGIKRVIGNSLLTKLQNSKIFMVGSGAIGCELLKNFAMLQIGAGESNGNIVVTDPDHIQTSNLNRQFLFREKHLRKPKSATAAAAVTQMNPRLKGHIKARLDKVCEATKDIFSNEFFEGLSIVANALDNVEARRYVDSRCVENKVALLESGTLSSKGHVQVIIPYKTETYGSKQDPNDANGEVPHCTLKMFPEETLHCVEWARDLFGKQFTLSPKALLKLLESESTFTPGPSDIQMLKDCLKMLEFRPSNFQEAVSNAAKVFYQIFRNDILQLLYTYPLDSKTKDGKPFWRLPKRPPTPIEAINPEDPLHATFISSYAVLLSKIHSIPYPKDFRDPLKRKEIAEIALTYKVEPFTPSDKVAKEMTEEVNNENQKQQDDSTAKEEVSQEGENEIFEKIKVVLADLREGGDVLTAKAEQFQKDEDHNGHIDLIYSMANLRSRNYKLDEMEWINVKLKAGRIMPALSTTTSCIAALQTIQLVKYIKGCKVDAMRNAFINLAIPILQLGEPGEVEKIKVHENLTTNLWERWSVSGKRSETLRSLISAIEQKYGVSVKGLDLVDGGQVYSDIVLSLQSKKEEKEKLLSKPLSELLSEQLQESTKYIDLTLLMSVKEQLIKHAPTLRVTLE